VRPNWAVAGIALVLGGLAGYVVHGSTDARGFGTVEGSVDCHGSRSCVPALAFMPGGCPTVTVAWGGATSTTLQIKLPAGHYRVAVWLRDGRLADPVKHADITVEADKVTQLGAMTAAKVSPNYPRICD
jgi:hypothetical protein